MKPDLAIVQSFLFAGTATRDTSVDESSQLRQVSDT